MNNKTNKLNRIMRRVRFRREISLELAPSQPLLTGQLIRELPLSPLLAQCLVNRVLHNKAEVSEFLGNLRPKLLADPFLIPNMEAAIDGFEGTQ